VYPINKFIFLAICFGAFCAKAQALSLHEGDIIGESEIIEDSSTAYIEAATQSRFGHVGVILKKNNQLVVYEEYPPQAQITTVSDFLKRAPGIYAVIRRKTALTENQLSILRHVGDEFVAKKYPYNYSQTRNQSSLNCSEFLHELFGSAGLTVGQVQTIGQMNLRAFRGVPWLLWKVSGSGVTKADQVVTPKSVMQSPGWFQISGSLNPKANLTDRELYLQWLKEGAAAGVAHEWYLFKWELALLSYPL
jgi:hypothetical protein